MFRGDSYEFSPWQNKDVKTVIVDNTGHPNAQYRSIGKAIDAAQPYDRIVIHNGGVYHETLVLSKPIEIVARGVEGSVPPVILAPFPIFSVAVPVAPHSLLGGPKKKDTALPAAASVYVEGINFSTPEGKKRTIASEVPAPTVDIQYGTATLVDCDFESIQASRDASLALNNCRIVGLPTPRTVVPGIGHTASRGFPRVGVLVRDNASAVVQQCQIKRHADFCVVVASSHREVVFRDNNIDNSESVNLKMSTGDGTGGKPIPVPTTAATRRGAKKGGTDGKSDVEAPTGQYFECRGGILVTNCGYKEPLPPPGSSSLSLHHSSGSKRQSAVDRREYGAEEHTVRPIFANNTITALLPQELHTLTSIQSFAMSIATTGIGSSETSSAPGSPPLHYVPAALLSLTTLGASVSSSGLTATTNSETITGLEHVFDDDEFLARSTETGAFHAFSLVKCFGRGVLPLFTGNTLRGGDLGISAFASARGKFEGNKITGTLTAGIVSAVGDTTLFVGNVVQQNKNFGAIVLGTAKPTVTHNEFCENSRSGVVVLQDEGSTRHLVSSVHRYMEAVEAELELAARGPHVAGLKSHHLGKSAAAHSVSPGGPPRKSVASDTSTDVALDSSVSMHSTAGGGLGARLPRYTALNIACNTIAANTHNGMLLIGDSIGKALPANSSGLQSSVRSAEDGRKEHPTDEEQPLDFGVLVVAYNYIASNAQHGIDVNSAIEDSSVCLTAALSQLSVAGRRDVDSLVASTRFNTDRYCEKTCTFLCFRNFIFDNGAYGLHLNGDTVGRAGRSTQPEGPALTPTAGAGGSSTAGNQPTPRKPHKARTVRITSGSEVIEEVPTRQQRPEPARTQKGIDSAMVKGLLSWDSASFQTFVDQQVKPPPTALSHDSSDSHSPFDLVDKPHVLRGLIAAAKGVIEGEVLQSIPFLREVLDGILAESEGPARGGRKGEVDLLLARIPSGVAPLPPSFKRSTSKSRKSTTTTTGEGTGTAGSLTASFSSAPPTGTAAGAKSSDYGAPSLSRALRTALITCNVIASNEGGGVKAAACAAPTLITNDFADHAPVPMSALVSSDTRARPAVFLCTMAGRGIPSVEILDQLSTVLPWKIPVNAKAAVSTSTLPQAAETPGTTTSYAKSVTAVPHRAAKPPRKQTSRGRISYFELSALQNYHERLAEAGGQLERKHCFETLVVDANRAQCALRAVSGARPLYHGLLVHNFYEGVGLLVSGQSSVPKLSSCCVSEADCGVVVESHGDPVVEHCSFQGALAAGIVVHHNGAGTFCDNHLFENYTNVFCASKAEAVIRRNHIEYGYYCGVMLSHGDQSFVERNHIRHNGLGRCSEVWIRGVQTDSRVTCNTIERSVQTDSETTTAGPSTPPPVSLVQVCLPSAFGEELRSPLTPASGPQSATFSDHQQRIENFYLGIGSGAHTSPSEPPRIFVPQSVMQTAATGQKRKTSNGMSDSPVKTKSRPKTSDPAAAPAALPQPPPIQCGILASWGASGLCQGNTVSGPFPQGCVASMVDATTTFQRNDLKPTAGCCAVLCALRGRSRFIDSTFTHCSSIPAMVIDSLSVPLVSNCVFEGNTSGGIIFTRGSGGLIHNSSFSTATLTPSASSNTTTRPTSEKDAPLSPPQPTLIPRSPLERSRSPASSSSSTIDLGSASGPAPTPSVLGYSTSNLVTFLSPSYSSTASLVSYTKAIGYAVPVTIELLEEHLRMVGTQMQEHGINHLPYSTLIQTVLSESSSVNLKAAVYFTTQRYKSMREDVGERLINLKSKHGHCPFSAVLADCEFIGPLKGPTVPELCPAIPCCGIVAHGDVVYEAPALAANPYLEEVLYNSAGRTASIKDPGEKTPSLSTAAQRLQLPHSDLSTVKSIASVIRCDVMRFHYGLAVMSADGLQVSFTSVLLCTVGCLLANDALLQVKLPSKTASSTSVSSGFLLQPYHTRGSSVPTTPQDPEGPERSGGFETLEEDLTRQPRSARVQCIVERTTFLRNSTAAAIVGLHGDWNTMPYGTLLECTMQESTHSAVVSTHVRVADIVQHLAKKKKKATQRESPAGHDPASPAVREEKGMYNPNLFPTHATVALADLSNKKSFGVSASKSVRPGGGGGGPGSPLDKDPGPTVAGNILSHTPSAHRSVGASFVELKNCFMRESERHGILAVNPDWAGFVSSESCLPVFQGGGAGYTMTSGSSATEKGPLPPPLVTVSHCVVDENGEAGVAAVHWEATTGTSAPVDQPTPRRTQLHPTRSARQLGAAEKQKAPAKKRIKRHKAPNAATVTKSPSSAALQAKNVTLEGKTQVIGGQVAEFTPSRRTKGKGPKKLPVPGHAPLSRASSRDSLTTEGSTTETDEEEISESGASPVTPCTLLLPDNWIAQRITNSRIRANKRNNVEVLTMTSKEVPALVSQFAHCAVAHLSNKRHKSEQLVKLPFTSATSVGQREAISSPSSVMSDGVCRVLVDRCDITNAKRSGIRCELFRSVSSLSLGGGLDEEGERLPQRFDQTLNVMKTLELFKSTVSDNSRHGVDITRAPVWLPAIATALLRTVEYQQEKVLDSADFNATSPGASTSVWLNPLPYRGTLLSCGFTDCDIKSNGCHGVTIADGSSSTTGTVDSKPSSLPSLTFSEQLEFMCDEQSKQQLITAAIRSLQSGDTTTGTASRTGTGRTKADKLHRVASASLFDCRVQKNGLHGVDIAPTAGTLGVVLDKCDISKNLSFNVRASPADSASMRNTVPFSVRRESAGSPTATGGPSSVANPAPGSPAPTVLPDIPRLTSTADMAGSSLASPSPSVVVSEEDYCLFTELLADEFPKEVVRSCVIKEQESVPCSVLLEEGSNLLLAHNTIGPCSKYARPPGGPLTQHRVQVQAKAARLSHVTELTVGASAAGDAEELETIALDAKLLQIRVDLFLFPPAGSTLHLSSLTYDWDMPSVEGSLSEVESSSQKRSTGGTSHRTASKATSGPSSPLLTKTEDGQGPGMRPAENFGIVAIGSLGEISRNVVHECKGIGLVLFEAPSILDPFTDEAVGKVEPPKFGEEVLTQYKPPSCREQCLNVEGNRIMKNQGGGVAICPSYALIQRGQSPSFVMGSFTSTSASTGRPPSSAASPTFSTTSTATAASPLGHPATSSSLLTKNLSPKLDSRSVLNQLSSAVIDIGMTEDEALARTFKLEYRGADDESTPPRCSIVLSQQNAFVSNERCGLYVQPFCSPFIESNDFQKQTGTAIHVCFPAVVGASRLRPRSFCVVQSNNISVCERGIFVDHMQSTAAFPLWRTLAAGGGVSAPSTGSAPVGTGTLESEVSAVTTATPPDAPLGSTAVSAASFTATKDSTGTEGTGVSVEGSASSLLGKELRRVYLMHNSVFHCRTVGIQLMLDRYAAHKSPLKPIAPFDHVVVEGNYIRDNLGLGMIVNGPGCRSSNVLIEGNLFNSNALIGLLIDTYKTARVPSAASLEQPQQQTAASSSKKSSSPSDRASDSRGSSRSRPESSASTARPPTSPAATALTAPQDCVPAPVIFHNEFTLNGVPEAQKRLHRQQVRDSYATALSASLKKTHPQEKQPHDETGKKSEDAPEAKESFIGAVLVKTGAAVIIANSFVKNHNGVLIGRDAYVTPSPLSPALLAALSGGAAAVLESIANTASDAAFSWRFFTAEKRFPEMESDINEWVVNLIKSCRKEGLVGSASASNTAVDSTSGPPLSFLAYSSSLANATLGGAWPNPNHHNVSSLFGLTVLVRNLFDSQAHVAIQLDGADAVIAQNNIEMTLGAFKRRRRSSTTVQGTEGSKQQQQEGGLTSPVAPRMAGSPTKARFGAGRVGSFAGESDGRGRRSTLQGALGKGPVPQPPQVGAMKRHGSIVGGMRQHALELLEAKEKQQTLDSGGEGKGQGGASGALPRRKSVLVGGLDAFKFSTHEGDQQDNNESLSLSGSFNPATRKTSGLTRRSSIMTTKVAAADPMDIHAMAFSDALSATGVAIKIIPRCAQPPSPSTDATTSTTGTSLPHTQSQRWLGALLASAILGNDIHHNVDGILIAVPLLQTYPGHGSGGGGAADDGSDEKEQSLDGSLLTGKKGPSGGSKEESHTKHNPFARIAAQGESLSALLISSNFLRGNRRCGVGVLVTDFSDRDPLEKNKVSGLPHTPSLLNRAPFHSHVHLRRNYLESNHVNILCTPLHAHVDLTRDNQAVSSEQSKTATPATAPLGEEKEGTKGGHRGRLRGGSPGSSGAVSGTLAENRQELIHSQPAFLCVENSVHGGDIGVLLVVRTSHEGEVDLDDLGFGPLDGTSSTKEKSGAPPTIERAPPPVFRGGDVKLATRGFFFHNVWSGLEGAAVHCHLVLEEEMTRAGISGGKTPEWSYALCAPAAVPLPNALRYALAAPSSATPAVKKDRHSHGSPSTVPATSSSSATKVASMTQTFANLIFPADSTTITSATSALGGGLLNHIHVSISENEIFDCAQGFRFDDSNAVQQAGKNPSNADEEDLALTQGALQACVNAIGSALQLRRLIIERCAVGVSLHLCHQVSSSTGLLEALPSAFYGHLSSPTSASGDHSSEQGTQPSLATSGPRLKIEETVIRRCEWGAQQAANCTLRCEIVRCCIVACTRGGVHCLGNCSLSIVKSSLYLVGAAAGLAATAGNVALNVDHSHIVGSRTGLSIASGSFIRMKNTVVQRCEIGILAQPGSRGLLDGTEMDGHKRVALLLLGGLDDIQVNNSVIFAPNEDSIIEFSMLPGSTSTATAPAAQLNDSNLIKRTEKTDNREYKKRDFGVDPAVEIQVPLHVQECLSAVVQKQQRQEESKKKTPQAPRHLLPSSPDKAPAASTASTNAVLLQAALYRRSRAVVDEILPMLEYFEQFHASHRLAMGDVPRHQDVTNIVAPMALFLSLRKTSSTPPPPLRGDEEFAEALELAAASSRKRPKGKRQKGAKSPIAPRPPDGEGLPLPTAAADGTSLGTAAAPSPTAAVVIGSLKSSAAGTAGVLKPGQSTALDVLQQPHHTWDSARSGSKEREKKKPGESAATPGTGGARPKGTPLTAAELASRISTAVRGGGERLKEPRATTGEASPKGSPFAPSDAGKVSRKKERKWRRRTKKRAPGEGVEDEASSSSSNELSSSCTDDEYLSSAESSSLPTSDESATEEAGWGNPEERRRRRRHVMRKKKRAEKERAKRTPKDKEQPTAGKKSGGTTLPPVVVSSKKSVAWSDKKSAAAGAAGQELQEGEEAVLREEEAETPELRAATTAPEEVLPGFTAQKTAAVPTESGKGTIPQEGVSSGDEQGRTETLLPAVVGPASVYTGATGLGSQGIVLVDGVQGQKSTASAGGAAFAVGGAKLISRDRKTKKDRARRGGEGVLSSEEELERIIPGPQQQHTTSLRAEAFEEEQRLKRKVSLRSLPPGLVYDSSLLPPPSELIAPPLQVPGSRLGLRAAGGSRASSRTAKGEEAVPAYRDIVDVVRSVTPSHIYTEPQEHQEGESYVFPTDEGTLPNLIAQTARAGVAIYHTGSQEYLNLARHLNRTSRRGQRGTAPAIGADLDTEHCLPHPPSSPSRGSRQGTPRSQRPTTSSTSGGEGFGSGDEASFEPPSNRPVLYVDNKERPDTSGRQAAILTADGQYLIPTHNGNCGIDLPSLTARYPSSAVGGPRPPRDVAPPRQAGSYTARGYTAETDRPYYGDLEDEDRPSRRKFDFNVKKSIQKWRKAEKKRRTNHNFQERMRQDDSEVLGTMHRSGAVWHCYPQYL